jgi:putative IMPACT (imprinted ancient) family translation regulator
LLGAGGLVRAYSHGTSIALAAAKIVTYEKYAELKLDCSYSDYQKYSVMLPTFGAIIDDTDFSDRVVVSFAVKETLVDKLTLKITEMSGGRDKPERVGERFDYNE